MSKVLDWDDAKAALDRAAEAGASDQNSARNAQFDLDQRYIDALGERDGKMVVALLCDYLELRRAWQVYSELFEVDQGTVGILNWASPVTFGVTQIEVLNSIIIRLHRFFDSTKGVLSFSKLDMTNQKLKSIQPAIEEARLATTNISNWRKEHVAHRSLSVALQRTSPKATKLGGEEIEKAVMAVGKALSAIHSACFPFELAWPTQNGITSDLLDALRAAHE